VPTLRGKRVGQNEAVRRGRAQQATCSKLPSTIEHKCNSYQKSFKGQVVLKEDDTKVENDRAFKSTIGRQLPNQ